MYQRCTNCKKRRKDVRRRVDPYVEEVKGKKVYLKICRPCERAIAQEI